MISHYPYEDDFNNGEDDTNKETENDTDLKQPWRHDVGEADREAVWQNCDEDPATPYDDVTGPLQARFGESCQSVQGVETVTGSMNVGQHVNVKSKDTHHYDHRVRNTLVHQYQGPVYFINNTQDQSADPAFGPFFRQRQRWRASHGLGLGYQTQHPHSAKALADDSKRRAPEAFLQLMLLLCLLTLTFVAGWELHSPGFLQRRSRFVPQTSLQDSKEASRTDDHLREGRYDASDTKSSESIVPAEDVEETQEKELEDLATSDPFPSSNKSEATQSKRQEIEKHSPSSTAGNVNRMTNAENVKTEEKDKEVPPRRHSGDDLNETQTKQSKQDGSLQNPQRAVKLKSTPLHEACKNGHLDTATVLLQYGFDPNSLDEKGRTPLHLASEFGHVTVVQLLLQNKAAVRSVSQDNETPLWKACQKGHADVLKTLLHYDASSVNDQRGLGKTRTALYEATFWGHVAAVRLLVTHNAHVDLGSEDGTSPLALASARKNIAIVKILLQNNANANSKDQKGKTPLLKACCECPRDVVEILISHGADVNAADDFGNTPFQLASEKGCAEVVTILLHHDVLLNVSNALGLTPLHFASKGGHLEVVKILVERQANVNAKAKDTSVAFGVTPLHWACQHGRANVADFLLRHGARMDILDQRNRSVLHAASEGGDVQLIRMLLSLGADVSARDIDGLRPIHLAAKARKTMALEFYVQDYPELVNVQTDTGLTPLGVASQQGHKDLVTLLLSLSEGNGD